MPFEKLYIWYDGQTNPCDADYKSLLSPGKFGDLSLKQCWDNMQIFKRMICFQKKGIFINLVIDATLIKYEYSFYGYGNHAKKLKYLDENNKIPKRYFF